MDKKQLSERDICTKYINPAIEQSGWDIKRQVREEYVFTDGRVIVRGNLTSRGKKKRADYLLFHKPNLPIALIEAKDNKHTIGSGMQQALNYGDILDVPFIFSSNGDGFLEHDRFSGLERELTLDEFPSPADLWDRYTKAKGFTSEQLEIVEEPYYYTESSKAPRYYQRIAINRVIEAISKGQNRMLLVMATGTGKTYTAFQILWRLWKSKKKKKILFLADRNILVDQTMQNDFRPFQGVMTKVENRTIDSSYEVFLALYQQLSGNENQMDVFRQFSPNFFDLIIIDECHRGSSKENSRWRQVLEYFNQATQIGLTATPKETETISNIHYFGEPIYTYSLKQGIEDGFLAPYKVIRIGLDKDLEGFRPEKGQQDKYGRIIEDKEYGLSDYDRTIVLERRTELVAKKVTEYLKKTDRFAKTIVFCVDQDHAERMRQALVNENSDLVQQDHRYVMRITGDDAEGKSQLDNFIDEESLYPTLVTTSKLLTTGVDCKTCKLIVLDSKIDSLTEFKQIIGRGTRLKPEYGKEYFTIMDFRNVSRLFADPDFDGEPVQIYEPDDGDDIVPPNPPDDEEGDVIGPGGIEEDPPGQPRVKYYVKDVAVKVLNERVQYYDKDGKLITESLRDYSKKRVLEEYATLDDFLNKWNAESRKKAIIDELKEHGVLLEALREEVDKELDDFDLIAHIAYDQRPLTRSERARKLKDDGYFNKYSDIARQVLESLLEKYQSDGFNEFEDVKVLELKPFSDYGNPMRIAKAFGGKEQYIKAVKELERNLYA
ncbi:EcoAI/FtnUII family type I restriction enzme subunit R [Brevibacillus sp. MER 51]|uniref:EcoAI/FtnUII family type I restriction enzme subunit R n=1 Tax=Brevibacillus sp. MER 51 TaxID=2939560 RepID=UPI0020411C66|nr:DEAD/DEAH box helicase family protein [Brevibacillus sp. MER 51]